MAHPASAWKQNKIWVISASDWLFEKKSITMHGNMNVTFCSHWLSPYSAKNSVVMMYEGWNFNSGNYLFTTDTK